MPQLNAPTTTLPLGVDWAVIVVFQLLRRRCFCSVPIVHRLAPPRLGDLQLPALLLVLVTLLVVGTAVLPRVHG